MTKRKKSDLYTERQTVSDQQRRAAGHERPVMADMQNTTILDVAVRPDADLMDIAANHDTRPEAGVGADMHITDDQAQRVEHRQWVDLGCPILECAYGTHARTATCRYSQDQR